MERERVLLVEDHPATRAMIRKLLSGSYEIVEAECGQPALDILAAEHKTISGIVLELQMPDMNGRDFLKICARSEAYAGIPVLVITADPTAEGEKACLQLGAWDFIRRPIDGDLLKLRLKNMIGCSQKNMLLKKIRHISEHDSLTGLYNRQHFLAVTQQMLAHSDPQKRYLLLHIDIKHFRLVNTLLGIDEGDRLLNFMAKQIQLLFGSTTGAVCCRMDADVFCVCTPIGEDAVLDAACMIKSRLSAYKPNYYLESAIGVYRIEDRTLSVAIMCDHAAAAAALSKGQYGASVMYYQKVMSDAAILEQNIMSEAPGALDSEQFEVYIQPKYDLEKNRHYGGEALARWNHPVNGLIAPAEFIPVFEKNGFIAKLDFYMWEHTCRLLRKWLDAGLHPDPISVNISRVNMYNPRLLEIIVALVRQNGISPHLLNLELTESAYMDNPVRMRQTVKKLQNAGFLVMLDDFGSGYSSLNTLTDMPVDVLKIEMRFLPSSQADSRRERILASVIRMAGWLEMKVVVEGVETVEQVHFLRDMGCDFVQGFYFAKPMPAAAYEQAIRTQAVEPVDIRPKAEGDQRLWEMIWSSSSVLNRFFDCIMEPMAVFEYDRGFCDPVSVNAAFREKFSSISQHVQNQRCPFLSREDASRIAEAFRTAVTRKGDAQIIYRQSGPPGAEGTYRLRLRYIQGNGNGALLMAMITEAANTDTPLQT